MAKPTYAEGWAKLAAVVKIFDELEKYCKTNSSNFIGLAETLQTTDKVDLGDEPFLNQAIQSARNGLNSSLAAAEGAISACINAIAKSTAVESPATNTIQQIRDIATYMAANSSTIKRRAITRGSFSSGSPFTGNGTFKRCTADQYNQPLEAGCADVFTIKCAVDRNTGTKPGQEIWTVQSKGFEDEVERYRSGRGYGVDTTIPYVTAENSLLANSSFDQFGGTAGSPDSITNWTSNITVNSTNFIFDPNNYYQTPSDGSTPYALTIKASCELTQNFSVNIPSFNRTSPYYIGLFWNCEVNSGAQGTLELHLGSKSKSVTVNNDTGWQLLVLPTTNDSDLWPDNFLSDSSKFRAMVKWTKTSGNINIDDLKLVEFVPINNRAGRPNFYIVGNSGSTPALLNDIGTITDTISADAIIQKWLDRIYGISLPSASSPSIADP